MSVKYDFNLAQQIYALCSASNAIGECTGNETTLQQKMVMALQAELPTIAGGWKVSWGPRVYMPSFAVHPQNTWFAAVSESQKMVVVAVAGTSVLSGLDWYNDFDVVQVVNFPQWVGAWTTSGILPPVTDSSPDDSANAYIANGTAHGVYNVLNNPSTIPTDKSSYIWQYLSKLDPGYTVVFTGHSMGGAIAPTMALGLKMANMSGSATTYTMPSAGPSPGNQNFNKHYYDVNFPATPMPNQTEAYEVYNLDLWNENDIVPQAWCRDTTQDRYLQRISSNIYAIMPQGPVGPKTWDKVVQPLVERALKRSSNSNIEYYGIPGQSFVGEDPIPPITNPIALVESVGKQHTHEYWVYLAIDQFVDEFKGIAGCKLIPMNIAAGTGVVSSDLKAPESTVEQVELLDV